MVVSKETLHKANEILKTTDVQNRTGWSLRKIRALIRLGKLKAFDSSTSDRPYWNILPESLDALLTGVDPTKPSAVKPVRQSNRRIDADVPKVFG